MNWGGGVNNFTVQSPFETGTCSSSLALTWLQEKDVGLLEIDLFRLS